MASLVAQSVKNPPEMQETSYNTGDPGLIPELERSPGEGNGHTPLFLPGTSHGRRSLVCAHPWGCRESDTAE